MLFKKIISEPLRYAVEQDCGGECSNEKDTEIMSLKKELNLLKKDVMTKNRLLKLYQTQLNQYKQSILKYDQVNHIKNNQVTKNQVSLIILMKKLVSENNKIIGFQQQLLSWLTNSSQ